MARIAPDPDKRIDVDAMIWWLGDFAADLKRGRAQDATLPEHKRPIIAFDASDLAVVEAIGDLLHALKLVSDDVREPLRRGYAAVKGEPVPPKGRRP